MQGSKGRKVTLANPSQRTEKVFCKSSPLCGFPWASDTYKVWFEKLTSGKDTAIIPPHETPSHPTHSAWFSALSEAVLQVLFLEVLICAIVAALLS